MAEWVSAVLLLVGSAFACVAGLGVKRMPDVIIRMHAATKAGTFGAGLVMIAVAVHSGDLGVASRAVAAAMFLVLTAPVAAHMIGRAAYLDGIRLWYGTHIDELAGRYDFATGRLAGPVAEGDEPKLPAPPRRERAYARLY